MTPTTTISPRQQSPAPGEVLDRAVAAVGVAAAAEVDLLVAAVEWAEAHVVTDPVDAAGWGDKKLYTEGVSTLAGPGAPLVAEFAPVEFAGRLGWSIQAGKDLISDSLELKHRLPRLWALVLEQVVPVRVARHIASCTTDLSAEAVQRADLIVCADPARINRVNAERLVDEIRLWFDPDRARDDEDHALAARGVWTHQGRSPATTEVTMLLDTPDAEAFDTTLSQVAGTLRGLGDSNGLDLRRAKAVGILADPQQALDLLTGVQSAPRAPQPATVFVHITEDSLARTLGGATAPTIIEKLGAASTDLIRDWLTGSTVIIRPVLDCHRTDAHDAHDPPEWMREHVIQRDAHCVFPGCRRDSRACDLDHIEPYDTGGPTTPANLAPLCRTHHRAKTHANLHYQPDSDGTYRWTLPTGASIRVIPTSRRPLTP